MPRYDAEDDDWEQPDEAWQHEAEDEGDNDPTLPCPYCKRPIHEDSPRCPYCEQYLSEEDAPPTRKPWWIIMGVLLGLWVVYRWIVG